MFTVSYISAVGTKPGFWKRLFSAEFIADLFGMIGRFPQRRFYGTIPILVD